MNWGDIANAHREFPLSALKSLVFIEKHENPTDGNDPRICTDLVGKFPQRAILPLINRITTHAGSIRGNAFGSSVVLSRRATREYTQTAGDKEKKEKRTNFHKQRVNTIIVSEKDDVEQNNAGFRIPALP